MLNISENNIECTSELTELKAPMLLKVSPWHLSVRNLLIGLLFLFLIFLFLPWTQTVQADGKVTTLRPEHRPQTIHATIAGRIEHWYVQEGQLVRQGDTIVYISEVKSDYFDPALVNRVGSQVESKEGSIEAYGNKASALDRQISAMGQELVNKIAQLETKLEQAKLKVLSDSVKIIEARLEVQLSQNQFERMQALYDKQLEPLTKLQERRLKFQDAQTKAVAAQNQYDISRNELQVYRQELSLAKYEYANKIAKAESDKFSTLSDQYDARAAVDKLRIERDNYKRRSDFYYILAPQDCYIIKAMTPGIGEIVKEGDAVVSIISKNYEPAVELFVRPLDLPLMSPGNNVRFTFDGWPAFFFSGWPSVSSGTFSGTIAAIDRNISTNGKFRVLVAPDTTAQPWPERLQIGGGAHGIALLKNVPMWYELWRLLNGFPPDLYNDNQMASNEKEAKNGPIPKAPIKDAK